MTIVRRAARAGLMLAAAASLAASRQAAPPAPAALFDLIIANARIVDGTGAPARLGDVGIRDGRIARIGRIAAAEARQRLDAAGLVLAPGFIDVHTHADDIASTPLAENFIHMGVTSIVAGSGGTSALHVGDALERAQDTGIAVNFATFIGHSTVRAAVMGATSREPTLPEFKAMQVLVFKAMAEGAVGLSTGLQDPPGIYAKPNEIIELARVAATEGGLYAPELSGEGVGVEAAIAAAIRVIRRVDMPLEISALAIDGPAARGRAAAALQLIDDARAARLRVHADVSPYTTETVPLSRLLPAWIFDGGAELSRQRLRDSATWMKAKAEMSAALAARGFSDLSFATIARYPPDPTMGGRSMREAATRIIGEGSADAQLEAARILMLNGGAMLIAQTMSEEDVTTIVRHALVSFGSDGRLDDAGVRPARPGAFGATARVLGEYVRERKVLTLEDAVRKMTSLPADVFGFVGRGVIREGAAADLVLFDPLTVKDVAIDARPDTFPAGIPHVLVNGVFVVRDGRTTGSRPGDILLRGRR